MPEITCTLYDPDIKIKLPCRWNSDWAVTRIDRNVRLNGKAAWCLFLEPLNGAFLPDWVHGCQRLDPELQTFYYYLPQDEHPQPIAVGSAFGIFYRVSEVKVRIGKFFPNKECLCWRLTLVSRRDPILYLPPAKDGTAI